MIDFGIYLAYILIGIAVILIVLFMVYHMIQDPKGGIKGLIGIGAILAIFFLSYAFSSGDVIYNMSNDVIADASVSKWSGAGIITGYILAGIGVLGLFYSEISGFIK